MSNIVSDYLYTREHEWLSFEENVVTIGITDYAQQSLGDIVFLDIPKPDSQIKADESFGVVESVKAVSDLYAPISGKVIEVNETLQNSPEIVNDDPYDEGWIVRVELEGDSETIQEELKKKLMDAIKYGKSREEEE